MGFFILLQLYNVPLKVHVVAYFITSLNMDKYTVLKLKLLQKNAQ